MSSKRYNAKCTVCKKEFVAKKKGTRFCSNVCRAQYSRDKRLKLIKAQGTVIHTQASVLRQVAPHPIKNKKTVTNYLLSQIELYKVEGYDWIRMEIISNFSYTLFGTPGTVPDKFSIGGYDFEKINSTRYSFKKA